MPFDPNIRLDNYYKEIEIFEREFYANLNKLMGKRATREELTVFLTQYDFYKMLVEQGYTGAATKFVSDYDIGIASMLSRVESLGLDRIAQVSFEQLDAMKQLELKALLRRGQDFSDDVRKQLLGQMFTGLSPLQIRDNVLPKIQEQTKFYPSWFASMLNTSYSEYQAVGLHNFTESFGNDIKFRLAGPMDKVTRKQCKHALQIFKNEYPEGLTYEQIQSGAVGSYKTKDGIQIYDFVKRGGFNCRHYWEPITNFEAV